MGSRNGLCGLTERTLWAHGTDSVGSRNGAGSGADSVGSRNGTGCVGSRNGADCVSSRNGAGSGADSVG